MKKKRLIFLISFIGLILPLFLPAWADGLEDFKDLLYDRYGIDAYGFLEARGGLRLRDDPHEKDASIGEMRLQTDLSRDFELVELKIKFDLLGDLVSEEVDVDLRDLNLSFSPLDIMDVKLGRQILTWGTGDLLFVADSFPKDWVSFFVGRDTEYLKAPSDAARISLFFDLFNVDLVYIPKFNGSVYVDGSRLSYWNPMLGRIAGRDSIFHDHRPDDFGTDSEYALRLTKNLEGTELALYGYYGFWQTPEGVNLLSPVLIYPELSIFSASIRDALWGGIGHLELGYYDSRNDGSGNNPNIRNSEFRFLVGFERELSQDFTGGIQYYLEYMQDYEEYERHLPDGMNKKDEYRHVLTLRLTKLLMNQNLTLSFFTYYSPSDADGYTRPNVNYSINDQWTVEIGGNIFFGSDDHTFFGQFKKNTNAYASLRFSF
ncbi:MAG: hypothetical protein JW896_02445 [Deltaproteobacteria bacterium]|nr:hypothetical protein [Deltaproteobacteria bacterium]